MSERYDELRRLLGAVKPKLLMAADHDAKGTSVIEGDWEARFCQCDSGDRCESDDDQAEHLLRAEYIAEALNAVPRLLVEVDYLRGELKAIKAAVADAPQWQPGMPTLKERAAKMLEEWHHTPVGDLPRMFEEHLRDAVYDYRVQAKIPNC